MSSGTPGLIAGDLYRPLTEARKVKCQGFTKWDRTLNKIKDTDIWIKKQGLDLGILMKVTTIIPH